MADAADVRSAVRKPDVQETSAPEASVQAPEPAIDPSLDPPDTHHPPCVQEGRKTMPMMSPENIQKASALLAKRARIAIATWPNLKGQTERDHSGFRASKEISLPSGRATGLGDRGVPEARARRDRRSALRARGRSDLVGQRSLIRRGLSSQRWGRPSGRPFTCNPFDL
jgi:hypothetical protein